MSLPTAGEAAAFAGRMTLAALLYFAIGLAGWAIASWNNRRRR